MMRRKGSALAGTLRVSWNNWSEADRLIDQCSSLRLCNQAALGALWQVLACRRLERLLGERRTITAVVDPVAG